MIFQKENMEGGIYSQQVKAIPIFQSLVEVQFH